VRVYPTLRKPATELPRAF